jgi:hypothetical protein
MKVCEGIESRNNEERENKTLKHIKERLSTNDRDKESEKHTNTKSRTYDRPQYLGEHDGVDARPPRELPV